MAPPVGLEAIGAASLRLAPELTCKLEPAYSADVLRATGLLYSLGTAGSKGKFIPTYCPAGNAGNIDLALSPK
jgi:hypothetical protein